MKTKWIIGVLLVAAVLFTAAPASAFSFQYGRHNASIVDFGAAFAPGAGDRATDTYKTTAAAVGDEQRSIFWIDALKLENNPPYNSGIDPELTGLVYDLECAAIVTEGTSRLYYYTSAGAYSSLFTGRLDLYEDPANNRNGMLPSVASDPATWGAVPAGSDPSLRDSFPTYSDGSSVLVLSATFVQLTDPLTGLPMVAGGKPIYLVQRFSITGNGSTELFAHLDVVYNNSNLPFGNKTWPDGMTSDIRFFANYFPNDEGATNHWPIKSQDPVQFETIPEPASLMLLGSALIGLIPVIRRRK